MIGILLVVGVLFAIFLPKRIKLYFAIKDNIESLGPEGKMFESYDVADDTLIRVGNDNISVAVPGGCMYEDRNIVDVYQSLDGKEYVSISKEINDVEVSFFGSDYKESEIFGIEYKRETLMAGFEKMGYGVPDSTYNTFKCLYLLKESDYSFWDYGKGIAYANAAYVKNEIMWMDVHYVYERDDMYALIMERHLQDEGLYYYCVEVYDPNNLNQSYIIIIKVEDKEQAYAIINSVKLK